MKKVISNNEQTVKAEKVEISLNHIIRANAKENETAKQLKKRLDRERKNETNEAGRILARDIRGSYYDIKVIKYLFSTTSREASEIFLSKLSAEVGKSIDIDTVMKLPLKLLMDYIKEIEGARGMVRGGINPTEWTNVIKRYYRGEKIGAIKDADALIMAYNQAY